MGRLGRFGRSVVARLGGGTSNPPPPPPATVPHFDGTKHTSVFFDDAESQTLDAAPSGFVLTQTKGIIRVRNAQAHNGTKSFAFEWDGSACGSDANLTLEKNMNGLSGEDQSIRQWFCEWYAYYPSGYWSNQCDGETKELLAFRDGTTNARLTLVATKNGCPVACPSIYPNTIIPSGTYGWTLVSAAEPGSTKPADTTPCECASKKALYRQHLLTNTKDPVSIANGAWHNFVMEINKESALDAGDGMFRLWIDDGLVCDYNGNDAANAAYQKCFTRTMAFGRPIQWKSIANLGMNPAVNAYYDEIRVYRTTNP